MIVNGLENISNDILNQLIQRDNQIRPYVTMIGEINKYKEKYDMISKTHNNDITRSKIYDEQFNNTMKDIVNNKNVNNNERNKIFEKLMDHNILQQKLLSTKEVIISNNNKIKILEQELSITQKKNQELESANKELILFQNEYRNQIENYKKENEIFLNNLIKEKDEKNKITTELLNYETEIKLLKIRDRKLRDEIFVLELELHTTKNNISNNISNKITMEPIHENTSNMDVSLDDENEYELL